MAYELVTTPAARRALKKLPRDVRIHLIDILQNATPDPLHSPTLKAPWRFLRSFHTRYKNTDYRVAYEVKDQQIIVHYAASRENFYRTLRQLRLRPTN